MNKKEILNDIQSMYEALEKAYDMAGGLRDSFTGVNPEGNEYQLKQHCNIIRGKIYELRELKGHFVNEVKAI